MKIRSFLRRIDWINHLFTFGGTLLGVLMAFYLSNYHENKQNKDRLEQAMVNILEEIGKNKENVKIHLDSLSLNIYALNSLESLMDSTYELITTQSKVDEFIREYPGFITVDDQTSLNDTLINFDISLSLYFKMLQLSDIAWANAKAMDILHMVDYQESFRLHSIYRMQKEVYGDAHRAFDLLKNAIKTTEHDDISQLIFEEYQSQIQIAYQFEQGLFKAYDKLLNNWDKP